MPLTLAEKLRACVEQDEKELHRGGCYDQDGERAEIWIERHGVWIEVAVPCSRGSFTDSAASHGNVCRDVVIGYVGAAPVLRARHDNWILLTATEQELALEDWREVGE